MANVAHDDRRISYTLLHMRGEDGRGKGHNDPGDRRPRPPRDACTAGHRSPSDEAADKRCEQDASPTSGPRQPRSGGGRKRPCRPHDGPRAPGRDLEHGFTSAWPKLPEYRSRQANERDGKCGEARHEVRGHRVGTEPRIEHDEKRPAREPGRKRNSDRSCSGAHEPARQDVAQTRRPYDDRGHGDRGELESHACAEIRLNGKQHENADSERRERLRWPAPPDANGDRERHRQSALYGRIGPHKDREAHHCDAEDDSAYPPAGHGCP